MTGYHMELMNSKSQASMKARIYVKLHGKKLLELSQLGLYHLISACLIVVLTSEASDMVMFLIAPIYFSMSLDLIKMYMFVFTVQQDFGNVHQRQSQIERIDIRGRNGFITDFYPARYRMPRSSRIGGRTTGSSR
jgi:hypothetical protein